MRRLLDHDGGADGHRHRRFAGACCGWGCHRLGRRLPVGERLGDIACRLEPIGRLLGHHLQTDGHQVLGCVGTDLQNAGGWLFLVGQEPLGEGPFAERRAAYQRVIHRAAEAVDIGTAVDAVAVQRLLGSQIVGGAEHVLVVGQRKRGLLVGGEPGQAQIEQFHHTVGIDEQIGRLDVAMDQSGGVGVSQSLGRLPEIFGRLGVGQGAIVVHDPLQVAPLDVFHHQVVGRPLVVDVVGADNVAVVEGRCGLRLAVEPFEVRGVVHPVLREHLDGHPPLHEDMFGEVDAAHPSGTEVVEQLVVLEIETLVPAFQKPVSLPPRDEARADEVLRQRVDVAERFLAAGVLELSQFMVETVRLHQPASPQQVQERIDRRLRHANVGPETTPAPGKQQSATPGWMRSDQRPSGGIPGTTRTRSSVSSAVDCAAVPELANGNPGSLHWPAPLNPPETQSQLDNSTY